VKDGLVTVGVLTPHAAPGPEAEFPEMAPGQVETRLARISAPGSAASGEAAPPTSPSGLRALAAPAALDAAAAAFEAGSVQVIAHASTTTAYAIGFDAETEMVHRLAERTGLPVVATGRSAVHALQAQKVQRLAMIHPPWFDEELNELGAAYFRSQGFAVVPHHLTELPNDPSHIEPDAVIDAVSRRDTADPDAIFIGGNGFRAAGAIAALDERLGRLVLESNQVLLWSALIAAGARVDVRGYGRLFSRP
jgi:maleate isomerase